MELPRLNFPPYEYQFKAVEGKNYILDVIRKQWVFLSPEEWVRQNMVAFLMNEKHFPQSRIANEVSIKYNDQSLRCDTLVYASNGLQPLVIVEYKRPTISLTQKIFDQVSVYNMRLNVPYILVSNGLQHIFSKIDNESKRFIFIKDIPDYNSL